MPHKHKKMAISTINHPPFKGMGSIIHIVAWGILIGSPFFFTGREPEVMNIPNYVRSLIVPISFMFIFYVNYFLLIDRYLFQKHTWKFFLSNLFLIMLAIYSVHFIMELLPPPIDWVPHPRPRPQQDFFGGFRFFLVNAMLYLLVSGLSVAIKMTGSWYQMETARRELEKSRAEAELQNLKSQLNPHFLFNTLNNIYSLITFCPERAQEAVHDLSRLLRYVLYESSQSTVPLQRELDFIRNYVELMRIRLPEYVQLSTQIEISNPETPIAPLLFISLIENAFKHGIGISHNSHSFIKINIQQKEQELICYIQNSYFPKSKGQDKSGSGIGLQNLNRRLALLYPTSHTFTYEQRGDSYVCILKIHLNK